MLVPILNGINAMWHSFFFLGLLRKIFGKTSLQPEQMTFVINDCHYFIHIVDIMRIIKTELFPMLLSCGL